MLYLTASQYVFNAGDFQQGQLSESTPPDAYLFIPIAYLESKLGSDSPVFKYWCKLCGGQWQNTWFQKSTLCTGGPAPIYTCSDPVRIEQVDWCGAAWSWVYSSFWAEFCDGIERPHCGYP